MPSASRNSARSRGSSTRATSASSFAHNAHTSSPGVIFAPAASSNTGLGKVDSPQLSAVTILLPLLLLGDALQAKVHEAQVGDRELEVHQLDVTQRFDGTAGVEHRGVFERAHDMAERIHVLE